MQPCWILSEKINEKEIFQLKRNKVNQQRITITDEYGLIGLSLIDPENRECILTEGVSDFFTTKMLFKDRNVLGLTTLSTSGLGKSILISLFDHFDIITDNDVESTDNRGTKNASNLRKFLISNNKNAKIRIPENPFKDITDQFIFNLKINALIP
jgi:hypothetical protein